MAKFLPYDAIQASLEIIYIRFHKLAIFSLLPPLHYLLIWPPVPIADLLSQYPFHIKAADRYIHPTETVR